MWVGIALPLSALHLGQHVALLSPRCNARLSSKEVSPECKGAKVKKQYVIGEICLVLAYLITTVFVIVLPVTFSWVHLTYTATFGAVCAYTRYLLSKLNTKFHEFP
jgi:hypothetical protein